MQESAPALSPSQDLLSISEQVTVLQPRKRLMRKSVLQPDRPRRTEAAGDRTIDSAAVSAVQALPEESEASEW